MDHLNYPVILTPEICAKNSSNTVLSLHHYKCKVEKEKDFSKNYTNVKAKFQDVQMCFDKVIVCPEIPWTIGLRRESKLQMKKDTFQKKVTDFHDRFSIFMLSVLGQYPTKLH